jgi:hypothetical protein
MKSRWQQEQGRQQQQRRQLQKARCLKGHWQRQIRQQHGQARNIDTPATARSLAKAVARSHLLAVESASSCRVGPKIRDANSNKSADP